MGHAELHKTAGMRSSSEPNWFPAKTMRDDGHLSSSQIAYESISEGVKEVEQQVARLQRTQSDRARILGGKLQVLLQGWTELGDAVIQNKLRLQEFVELQDFFRSYLAMM